MVHENHSFHAPLARIFRRKIKRSRREHAQSDDGCSEFESDDSDDFDDDFDDGNDMDDSCPAGCDALLYGQVIELREKRLDQEDTLAEFQKVVDDFKRTCDRHCQRKKQIERDLHSHVKELQSLQTEKQQHLNQSLLCHGNLQRGSLHVKIYF